MERISFSKKMTRETSISLECEQRRKTLCPACLQCDHRAACYNSLYLIKTEVVHTVSDVSLLSFEQSMAAKGGCVK